MRTCKTLALCMGMLVLGALAGCATTRQESVALADVVVHVDDTRQVWFNGDPYAVRDLPAALKAVRVAHKQPIRIHIPNRKDRELFVQLSSALRTAGFTRFFFVTDPHAEAAVSEPGKPLKNTLEPVNPFGDEQPREQTTTPTRNQPQPTKTR